MHHWLANSPDYCEKQNVLAEYQVYPWLGGVGQLGEETAWCDDAITGAAW